MTSMYVPTYTLAATIYRCRRCEKRTGSPVAVKSSGYFASYAPHCRTCRREMRSGGPIRGKRTDHKCDARCMASTGPNCECSCGGRNHGASWS